MMVKTIIGVYRAGLGAYLSLGWEHFKCVFSNVKILIFSFASDSGLAHLRWKFKGEFSFVNFGSLSLYDLASGYLISF